MTFEEFYEHYLSLHQNKWCRRLHVVGQFATIAFFLYCLIRHRWLMLLLTPFVIYPFAWIGHIFFEKNKPAAWTNPLWAKKCDWLMLRDILNGKIEW